MKGFRLNRFRPAHHRGGRGWKVWNYESPRKAAEQLRISLSALQPFRLENWRKLQVLQLSPKRTRIHCVRFERRCRYHLAGHERPPHLRTTFQTTWVTIHDTAHKALHRLMRMPRQKPLVALPFKRPENGQFRPGTDFSDLYSMPRVTQTLLPRPGRNSEDLARSSVCTCRAIAACCRFSTAAMRRTPGSTTSRSGMQTALVFVEDAGDTCTRSGTHLTPRFCSTCASITATRQPALRILAEGRDASATLDSQFGAFAGFQNDGDNEITGWHQSNGDPGVGASWEPKFPLRSTTVGDSSSPSSTVITTLGRYWKSEESDTEMRTKVSAPSKPPSLLDH